MLKYSLTLFAAVFALCRNAYSQALPPIQTDRPDQTECPYIVPARHFQVETGFNYEQEDKETKNYLYPTVLWKYGVNEKFELRLITEMNGMKTSAGQYSGLSPVTVGFKTSLVEEKGIIPKISFIGHLTIPSLASENMKAAYYAPAFRFSLQHTLSEKVSFGYNLGAEWDGETPEPVFIYTLTTGFSITEKFGSYIELYGFAPQKEKADHRFDAGVTYLLKNNVMADLSGGVGLTDNAPDYFVSAGFSFRLKN